MTIGDVNQTSADATQSLRRHPGARGRRRMRIAPVDREGPLPLSFGQQQMWFLNRMEPDSPEYLIPLILRLRGPLDPDAMSVAIDAIIERHEILRTRYALAGTEPVQVIGPVWPDTLTVTDLREAPDGERQAMRLAEQDASAGIDLAREWPLRARLIRIADDDHLLVVIFHHIACDAWSLRVFAEDLSACYRSAIAGDPCPLEPLPIQYADFAAYQRDLAATPAMERSIEYWRNQLAGHERVDLPADRQRPDTRSWQGDAIPVRIPEPLADAVRELARAHGVTAFTVLLAAFQALLARYTGRPDVVVGTVATARTRPELQRLIGYGINNLVLRGQWPGDLAFSELITLTQVVLLDALDHQQVPFAQLVDKLSPERDLSRTPLFQVSFIMAEPKVLGIDLPGIAAQSLEVPWRTAKFDLSLQMEEVAEGAINGQLEYATALFDRDTVERVGQHLVRLLAHAASRPTAMVGALEILGEDELAVVRDRQREAQAPAPAGQRSVADAFEAQVRATPAAVAVVCGDVTLSYAELNRRANQLAHHLRSLGAAPDTLVGVCLERGVDVVITLVAVLKSGAAYLPLDPSYPADRLTFMVADAGARIVVTQSAYVPLAAQVHPGELVVLDRDESAITRHSPLDPQRATSADNLSYVIYTSGSTGRPKGVCVTHGSVLRLFTVTQRHYGFDHTDVWSLFHSYAFDFYVWEMWGALLYGGCAVVVPFHVARSTDDFLNLLVKHKVTVLSQTPSAFRALIRFAADGDERIARLKLRYVIFGGEKLQIPELRPWAARLGLDSPALVNMYGITETTVHTTYHRLTGQDLGSAASPIGGPLSDLRIYLLDPHGRLVPVGVPGEIHVGGAGLARGYLNRPGLTAERFVPDPFGPPGSRLYRSGDLARRRLDGTLDFLGRIDNQVQIRGYRIELGEVQAALRDCSRLHDAVVVAHEDTPGRQRLVAYVVPEGDDVPPTGELRTLLARSLPDYMIPAVFVPLKEIPLTVNGKLDVRRLPPPDGAASAPGGEYIAPRTPVEEWVAAAWSQVLGVARVGVADSFFDLGGDSIRAVALVGALRDAGLNISLTDVFERRTVAGVCELVASRQSPAPELTLVAPFELITKADRERLPADVVDAYPLSRLQLGMLVEMLADHDLNAYHNVTSFRIRDDKPLSPEAIQEATRIVVGRHEVLRTSFELTGYSTPIQLVHPAADVGVRTIDLRRANADEQREAIRAFTSQERSRQLDLSTPPLVRVTAHMCDGNTWWISITECHAILEGWSYHSLLMELLGYYRRIRDGLQPEPLELPAIRYADFIASELQTLADDRDRAHWRVVVSAHPKLSLPAAWGDGPDSPRTVHRIKEPLPGIDSELRPLAAECGASVKSVLMAAHLKVMSMLTDEPAFFTGLVCHGRPEAPGTERVFGVYLNTVPFAFDRSARTWRELVGQVFAQEAQAWAHRRFPMPEIQREMGGGQRLIDVRFAFLDFPQLDTTLIDVEATVDESPSEFGLAIIALGGNLLLTSNTQVVSEANLARLAAMYRAVLAAMLADPDGDAQAAYLPPGERERLLNDGNLPAMNPGPAQSVHGLFELQVTMSPDSPAVTFNGQSMTYRQLDARANQIAHRLRELGATAETTVGVLLDRGPDLVACLLAVWKAGAAYIPLDPSFPAQRIGMMLADASARIAVTGSRHRGLIAAAGHDVTVVDIGEDEISRRPTASAGIQADPDRLAYVIFTSGSTGRPKGVQVTHRGLANHVRWAAETLAAQGTRGAPLFSSVAFDLIVPNLWAPLVTGQPVHMLPPGLDIADLGHTLAARGPFSFIKLTPGHLDVLSRQLDDEQAGKLAAVIVVAGEALLGQLADRWLQLLGPGRLVNEYGPTEASVGSSVFGVDEPATSQITPIGRPLPGMTLYVLDAGMHPVPIDVPGELYVGGTGVARGYAGRPGMTAGRFLPDPFGRPGARLYRTGDTVRVRPDGVVCFLGRVDDQVKLRGYRIEPGEIRSTLLGHPAVLEAVVVASGSGTEDRQLVAYCVPAQDARPAAAELAAHCAASLPEYMVPAIFMMMERLPLNANGKVDRGALPQPDLARAAGPQFAAPRSPLEHQIAEVWRVVLELDQVSVHESFFDLGGHSIRGVALVGALRAAGLDVGVGDVFEHRTIAELAAVLAARTELSEDTGSVPPFALISAHDKERLPGDITDAYPLSYAQRGMLAEMLADPSRSIYRDCASFQVRDDRPFSQATLEQAVQVVVDRHEILRTSFDLAGYSVPLQLVHARAQLPVSLVDLRGLTEAEQELAVRRLHQRERAAMFDLGKPPLMRLTALIQGELTWRLAFTQLHAITEGWSFHSMLMEVLSGYRRLRDGLAPEPYQAPAARYADFIAAEQRSLESEEDRAYWQQVVADFPKLTLPSAWAGDPRMPRDDYGVIVVYEDLHDGLRALATASRTSLKSVLHAAHLKVMSMLTPEPAFSSGLVCSTRPQAQGADKMYGVFLNTVPFAFERPAGTWRELAAQTFKGEAELLPHQRLPMTVIQREMGDGSRLIDVLFTYQEYHQIDTDLIEVDATEGVTVTEFGLNVAANPRFLALLTHTHAISRASADRLAAMFRAVLEAMAADPDGDARAAYLPPGEGQPAITAGPAPAVTMCMHEVLEQRASEAPGAPAVVVGAGELSYAQLNARANQVAHHLRDLGVGPESLVGVCLQPGLDLIPVLLGVLKAGGAYLPLPVSAPAERLRFMLGDTVVSVVVTDGEHAPALADVYAGDLVILDQDEAAIASSPATNLTTAARPDNLAYVIYTSGSTGRPKGVGVTHASVLRLFTAMAGRAEFDAAQTWALLHSHAFDVSVWEMWGALLHGARLVVVPPEIAQAPDELFTFLERHQVTTVAISPVAFRALIGSAGGDGTRLSRLALREVLFGGDPLEAADLAEWVASQGIGRTRLTQGYGPTEATVQVTYHVIGEADLSAGGRVPIGRPVDDMRVYVLDAAGRPVPDGVPGELCAAGPGVARGYIDRPALTAELFVADPYGPAGSRYYRTGDLVRRRADGNLDFLGRIDDQVKVRGYRVEPGEVQAVLAAHPQVREAVVIAYGDDPGGKRLVAYYTPAGAGPVQAAELAAHCAQRLPDYMVPGAFVALDRIPLTRNGKLDRRGLPAPDRASLWSSTEFLAPRTATERRLAGIWAGLLGVDQVGAHDRFMDLGGDSLMVLRALSQARSAGLPVSLRMIYQYGSIAELAGAIDRASALLAAGGRDGRPLQLTPAQRILLDRNAAGQPDQYQASLHLTRPVDAETLDAALRAVTSHHDALRLRVVPVDRRWHVTLAAADAAGPVRRASPAGRSQPGRTGSGQPVLAERAVNERAVTELGQRLDIADGPVLDALLVSPDGGQPARLAMAAPALVMDRASWLALLEDLETAYHQLAAGQEVALPPASIEFGPWAGQLADMAARTELTGQAHHWLNLVPGPPLPADGPEGTALVASARTITESLPAGLAGQLRQVPAQNLRELMLAALAVVLTRWAGGDRLLVDVEGRPQRGAAVGRDLRRAVGPFTHRFPVALWIPPRQGARAVLRSVGEQLRAVPDDGLGYGMLRHLAVDDALADALARMPSPAVRFGFAQSPADGAGPSGTFTLDDLVAIRDPMTAREHLLEVDVLAETAQIRSWWTYSPAVHHEATIRRLMAEYAAELATMADSWPAAEASAPAARGGRPRSVSAPSPAEAVMSEHHVPGVSLATIRGGELVSADAYGRVDARGSAPVTSQTLFRVASVSKQVTALGVLRLVTEGRLDLDKDVNSYLVRWRLPGTGQSPVTARHLLANVAGLATEPDHAAYGHDEPLPTALEALAGRHPARTPQVRPKCPPGQLFEKNKNNYLVLDLLMTDITGRAFPQLMKELVFEPLGMVNSSFDPLCPATASQPVARGHDAFGIPVAGLGPAHPAIAAGGLWSTAEDIAKAQLEIRRAYLGQSALITQSLAEQMLTPTPGTLYGLSTVVDHSQADLDFGSVGEFTGYFAVAMCRIRSGDGFVLLTNADGGREIARIMADPAGDSGEFGRLAEARRIATATDAGREP
jgi:amino acid adenylation domain-containing protein/non-ribosomal peptide synthase protein (TIGR01720 family)